MQARAEAERLKQGQVRVEISAFAATTENAFK
jgi:hypothetical protein